MYRAIANGGKLAPYKWNAATLSELIAMLNSVGGSLWVADPQYLALNSDDSGTVTGGSAVGYMRDLCAAGVPMTQPTTAAKPLINQVSGKWALQFDGVNDFLATVSLPAVAAETMIIAGQFTRLDATQQRMVDKSDSNQRGLFIRINGQVADCGFGNGATRSNLVYRAVETGVQSIYTAVGSSGNVRTRLNGVQTASTSFAYAPAPSATITIGAAPPGASVPAQANVFASVYAPVALSDAQCHLVELYLASLSGVTIA